MKSKKRRDETKEKVIMKYTNTISIRRIIRMNKEILVLSKRGVTSWGAPWRLSFGKAVLLGNDKREIDAIFFFAKDKDGIYLKEIRIDQNFKLTLKQKIEIMKLSMELITWCKGIAERSKVLALPAVFDELKKQTSKVKNFYEFTDSDEYKNIIHKAIDAARKGLNATSHVDDDLFSEWWEEEDEKYYDGELYEIINTFIFSVAEKMCPDGTTYGWIVHPDTLDWNQTPMINPITGEHYSDHHDPKEQMLLIPGWMLDELKNTTQSVLID